MSGVAYSSQSSIVVFRPASRRFGRHMLDAYCCVVLALRLSPVYVASPPALFCDLAALSGGFRVVRCYVQCFGYSGRRMLKHRLACDKRSGAALMFDSMFGQLASLAELYLAGCGRHVCIGLARRRPAIIFPFVLITISPNHFFAR